MKAVCIILCVLLMVHHNVAQHTIDTRVQDNNGEILEKLNKVLKTLGLYLGKMDLMAEQVKSSANQVNLMEDQMESIKDQMESMKVQMKSMAKQISDFENQCTPSINDYPCNCLDLLKQGNTESGVYEIYLQGYANSLLSVYCDMVTDGGGWLVIQRRADGSENFQREWYDYKNGFGDITNEFWLGNDYLSQVSDSCGKQYELRIDMGDYSNNTRYAKYSAFSVSNEDHNYRLTLGNYTGNAGDSLRSTNGMPFSTPERDNDDSVYHNCANLYKGPWWYEPQCGYSNLNGLYNTSVSATGVVWDSWKGFEYSLKFTEMKIRPK